MTTEKVNTILEKYIDDPVMMLAKNLKNEEKQLFKTFFSFTDW